MNDQKSDASLQDDEYRFEDFDKFESSDDVEATVTHTQTSEGEESSTPFEMKKDHRKMIVIGIVLVIILGFGINSLVNRMTHVKIPKETAKLPDATAGQQPMLHNGTSQNVMKPVAAAVPVATESEVNRLNDVLVAQQQTMDQMQTSIGSLQDSVNSLNSALGDVTQKMTDALDKIPTKTGAARPKAPVMMPPEPVRPTFTIRALVPGRAWLQASDGQSITVINGDTVPGYGTVQDIDLNAGQVVLSDGTIMGYNFNS